MKLEKEELEKLNAEHPEGIFEGEVTFGDADGNPHTVSFVYRSPVVADIEEYTQTMQKSPIVANLNLLQSVVVYPESAAIVAALRPYPIAYGRFIEDALIPFFGANVAIKKRRL